MLVQHVYSTEIGHRRNVHVMPIPNEYFDTLARTIIIPVKYKWIVII